MSKVRFATVFCLCAPLLFGATASAQLSSQGGPIYYSADSQDLNDKDGTTVLFGNVDIVQDDTRLQANVVTLFARKAPGDRPNGSDFDVEDLERIIAEGDVFLVRADQVTRGDRAVYDDTSRTVTFTGNVIAATADAVTRGSTLIYEIDTGVARMNPDRRPGQRVQGRVNTSSSRPER